MSGSCFSVWVSKPTLFKFNNWLRLTLHLYISMITNMIQNHLHANEEQIFAAIRNAKRVIIINNEKQMIKWVAAAAAPQLPGCSWIKLINSRCTNMPIFICICNYTISTNE